MLDWFSSSVIAMIQIIWVTGWNFWMWVVNVYFHSSIRVYGVSFHMNVIVLISALVEHDYNLKFINYIPKSYTPFNFVLKKPFFQLSPGNGDEIFYCVVRKRNFYCRSKWDSIITFNHANISTCYLLCSMHKLQET